MSEENIHRNLHPELHPLLLEFHGIDEGQLKAVWCYHEHQCLDTVIFEFEHNALVVKAEPYDDTIVFHLVPTNDLNRRSFVDASSSEPWSDFIGKMFGWGWIIINQQDALDGILLSFDGIMPQLMLVVIASSIKVSTLREHSLKESA